MFRASGLDVQQYWQREIKEDICKQKLTSQQAQTASTMYIITFTLCFSSHDDITDRTSNTALRITICIFNITCFQSIVLGFYRFYIFVFIFVSGLVCCCCKPLLSFTFTCFQKCWAQVNDKLGLRLVESQQSGNEPTTSIMNLATSSTHA